MPIKVIIRIGKTFALMEKLPKRGSLRIRTELFEPRITRIARIREFEWLGSFDESSPDPWNPSNPW